MKIMTSIFCKALVIICGLFSTSPFSFATENNTQASCPTPLNLKSYIEQVPDLEGKDQTTKLITLKIMNQMYVGTISMVTKYNKSLKTFLRARVNGLSLKLAKDPTRFGRKIICEYEWGTPDKRQIKLLLSTQPRMNHNIQPQKDSHLS